MDKDQVKKSRQNYVIKSNEIVQKGRHNLTMQEQKILLYVISKIKPADLDFKQFHFSIQDFARCAAWTRRTGKTTPT
ncbi:MAG: replication initiation protein [Eubacteriaceae bacterium]|nr:replication initiation protein [Eubacteriaceae bacterium]